MIAFRPVAPGKRGSNIPTQVIDTAMTRHPDGFGIAWREDGVLWRQKFGPSERKSFRKAIKRIDHRQDIEYVAHFRWATHGPRAASHSHPYEYYDPKVGTVLVFHNGIIDIPTISSESDTEVFVRDILAHLPSRWWAQPALRYLVSESISWSRLVIMTADETINLQEADGEWDGGLWYSSSHRPTSVGAFYSDKGTESNWTGTGWRGTTRSAFGDMEDDDDDDTIIHRVPAGVYQWMNGGHTLTAIKNIDRLKDGEFMEALICDECHTVGDAYIVDGRAYVDMAHKYGIGSVDAEAEREAESMEREADDLLPLDVLPPVARERILTVQQVH